MNLSKMFKKTKDNYIPLRSTESRREESHPEVPEGLVRKCNKCGKAIFTNEVKSNYYICPQCGGYFRMHAFARIRMITEPDSFEEWDTGMQTKNPLQYKGYEEKLAALREKTKLDESVITGKGKIGSQNAVLAVMDGRFLMASMGEVTGEKIARAVERATKEKLPVIIFTCSGGARMQEGITSLMQMAKTSAALKRHSDAGLLYITVLTDPTTGGVTASFAMLGDIILAEPKALIGFAGPRVIEQTIGQKLPKGFQRSEFLLEHGFVDAIVERSQLKETLQKILEFHSLEKAGMVQGNSVFAPNQTSSGSIDAVAGDNSDGSKDAAVETGSDGLKETVNNKLSAGESLSAGRSLSAWERVTLSRRQDRPVGEDYIKALFDDFTEFRGDRYFADDQAIIGGIAYFNGMPVTVIAQAKGKNTKENIARNFGMPSPEGYRKALRLMKQAEKFHRPVICFVDTPGAFCGLEAEERGQGEAIARNLYEMSALKTPILSLVIGEGGSGGALAMATADEVWMMENSVYSILSPEGYAAILWKDSTKAKEAAQVMKMTAADLKEAGIVEEVFPEPESFTEETLSQAVEAIKVKMAEFLQTYSKMSQEELVERRYQRFRNL
ncbi:MAG: acetyl-CoA carboxylase carboxyltransferase subunit alpha [Bacteroidales bacterium]|nr:acetyl-CoA carboxylase carboxyltransferase subunit alpha [Lachnoclostridium sp.]MCM1384361.1 acetyl-CoA carboxylase carboxyltransferase subunit alpha [Lachnoclostridium sp.]MCM1464942.1 acetyl-CoA carboxylase carboxyltransferase subunit alpha [Bacteroidales bacterium]